MNKPEEHHSELFDEIFDSITPMEAEKIEHKMLLAAKIADAMKAKGWNKKQLLTAMGQKNPSVATKWLSGVHNFTADTLIELGHVLGVDFLNLQKTQNVSTVRFKVMLSQTCESWGNDNMHFIQTSNENIIKDKFTLKTTISNTKIAIA